MLFQLHRHMPTRTDRGINWKFASNKVIIISYFKKIKGSLNTSSISHAHAHHLKHAQVMLTRKKRASHHIRSHHIIKWLQTTTNTHLHISDAFVCHESSTEYFIWINIQTGYFVLCQQEFVWFFFLCRLFWPRASEHMVSVVYFSKSYG